MTIRLSTGARNAMLGQLGLMGATRRGVLKIYSGAQPATADAAVTGTLLLTISLSSGAVTPETPAVGTVQVTGGSGSITDVTVGGLSILGDQAVAYNTSVGQTAIDLAAAINKAGVMVATVATDTVTIKPRPGTGVIMNSETVAVAGTLTTTAAGMNTAGVDAVNALELDNPASGVVAKPAAAAWSGNGITAGVAGWFRFYGDANDAGSLVSGAPYYPRIDGSVAVSGADMNMPNITIAASAPYTIDEFEFELPAA